MPDRKPANIAQIIPILIQTVMGQDLIAAITPTVAVLIYAGMNESAAYIAFEVVIAVVTAVVVTPGAQIANLTGRMGAGGNGRNRPDACQHTQAQQNTK
jgi:hypothetical protein